MPNKVFQFGIEIDGIEQLLIQDVKFPEVEIAVVEHGATNYNEKTAGGVAVSPAELMKIKPAGEGDSWAWDRLKEAQNMFAGGGLPENYQFDCIFKEYAPDGITTLNAWLWEGCWVSKVSPSNYKRGNQSENTIETVTLQVTRVDKIT